MPRIPMRIRMEVLTLYFAGFLYNEIVAEMRRRGRQVSKGSVVNIVDELKKGVYPQFDLVLDQVEYLRQLAVALRKQGLSVSEASLGLTLFKRLIHLGVEPSRLEDWIRMCKRLSPPGYPVERFVKSALRLRELEEETGKSFAELVREYEDRHAGLEEFERGTAALMREQEGIRASFKNQGLTWEEGLRLVGEIQDLREEKEKLVLSHTHLIQELGKTRAQLRAEKDRLERLRQQIASLNRVYAQLGEETARRREIAQIYREGWFKDLEYQSRLKLSIKNLEDQRIGLQRQVKNTENHGNELEELNHKLEESIEANQRKVEELKEYEDALTKTIRERNKRLEEMKKSKEAIDKALQEAVRERTREVEEKKERILSQAEKEKKKILDRARRREEKLLHGAKEKFLKLEEEKENIQAKIEQMKEEEREKEDTIQNLNWEIFSMRTKLGGLKEAIKEGERKLESLKRRAGRPLAEEHYTLKLPKIRSIE